MGVIPNVATLRYEDAGVQVTKNTPVVNVNVVGTTITIKKTVDKPNALVGETIRYTITVENKGTTSMLGLMVTDALNAALQLVPNSVKLNGTAVPDVSLTTGIALPSLAGGGSSTIVFDAKIIGEGTK